MFTVCAHEDLDMSKFKQHDILYQIMIWAMLYENQPLDLKITLFLIHMHFDTCAAGDYCKNIVAKTNKCSYEYFLLVFNLIQVLYFYLTLSLIRQFCSRRL